MRLNVMAPIFHIISLEFFRDFGEVLCSIVLETKGDMA